MGSGISRRHRGRSREGKFIRRIEAELLDQLGDNPRFAQLLLGRIDTLAAMGIWVLMARSVRFFAFIFLMRLRTWTFTVLSHMFNS